MRVYDGSAYSIGKWPVHDIVSRRGRYDVSRKILAAVIITGIVCAAAGPLSAQEAAKGGAGAGAHRLYREGARGWREKRPDMVGPLDSGVRRAVSRTVRTSGMADGYGRNETNLDQLRADFHYRLNRPRKPFPGRSSGSIISSAAPRRRFHSGQLLVMPFTPAYASGKLAKMPDGTNEEMNRKLNEAERLLELCARKETMGRAWWKHLLGVAVNGAGSVIIWQCQKGKDPGRTRSSASRPAWRCSR